MADTYITMSEKEAARYPIIRNLVEGRAHAAEAALQCGLSVRQVKRVKHRVAEGGAHGMVHRSRGKLGNRALPAARREEIKRIVAATYADFGPTLAAEKLAEVHGISVGAETLRGLMTAWGLWTPRSRKRNSEYRHWRPRKERYGEMIQFDGSYHDWFEGRSPVACLLAAVDDATGRIQKLQFAAHEGVQPVFAFWKAYIEDHGAPRAIYLDRHSTYAQNPKKSILDHPEAMTQFERAMRESGIDVIHAYSPQAKGRIERLFGTLQDRLVKELRLRKVADAETAQQFLAQEFIPWFNARFGVAAGKPGDLHRPLSAGERARLPHIFALRHIRRVLNDFTVRFENSWLQLSPEQPTLVCRRDAVVVEVRLDQNLHLFLRGKELSYVLLPERPLPATRARVTALAGKTSSWKPSPDHPWRKPFLRQEYKVEAAKP